VGGKGGGGGRGEKWTKPCMHIWIIKEKWKKKKGAIPKEDIIYTPNISIPNFRKEILLHLKAQISSNTIMVDNVNTTLSQISTSSRQKQQ
jgi:hypothetical protein